VGVAEVEQYKLKQLLSGGHFCLNINSCNQAGISSSSKYQIGTDYSFIRLKHIT
jgi:hypothetical protein